MTFDPVTMTQAEVEALEADCKALRDLLASRGWSIIEATLQDNLVRAAVSLSENPRLTPEELHHRRGALFAANTMATLPARLLKDLESRRPLAEATAPLRPSKKD